MNLLKKYIPEHLEITEESKIFTRIAARGVIQHENEILLIYTKCYNDFSLPGGGVENEAIEEGLLRELNEETGAKNTEIISPIGIYEEYRDYYKEGYDTMHMLSYIYKVSADYELGTANPEPYEIKNGSVPVWINLEEAIRHNETVISKQEASMGLSILRETFLLKYIKNNLSK